ncbi:MAG: transcription elongation factor Spt5 [Candidatus Aenigmarchaeota archaeon]|nr:transcription elongation factor Spt5 [Candidatus Aenigmarchaeota archaeon]
MLFTIKTVVGRENIVIDNVATKAKTENLTQVRAFIHPEEIKGYVFVEGDIKEIEMAVQDVPHVRGLIKKGIGMEQVERYLQPKTVIVELGLGDILEVVGGPFKGEKGKVTRYDKVKREVTMELLEAAVPIPVTVSVEFIKVLEKSATQ